ncbi:MAG: ribosome silencing factor [Hyphomicrobiales bacterium]|nr:MAG: ribosome silencing factor [Hyphomicrobiales bacterium]
MNTQTSARRAEASDAGVSVSAHRGDPSKLPELLIRILEDAKAEDLTSIDLIGKSSVADLMIVASGRSQRHVGAIADQLRREVRKHGYGRPRLEGLPHCDWVLVDCGNVIVHVFRPEVREFYNLEKLWSIDTPFEHKA